MDKDKILELSKFGGVPSPKDYRDIALADVVEPVVLPDSYKLDVSQLKVWHQRKLGACVGHATAKYKQYLDWKDEDEVPQLSPRFVYALCKMQDGYDGEGTYPRISMKVLKDHGCATQTTVPNDTELSHAEYIYNLDKTRISDAAFKEAEKYKISSYASVGVTLDGIKRAIYQCGGASALLRVGNEWYTDVNGNVTWNAEAILPLRPPKVDISGHQVYLYGYEKVGDDTKIFLLNSWSKEWGDNGTGWFWWSQYAPFVSEAYTAVDIPKSELNDAQNLPPADKFKYNFTKQLSYGMDSEDVKKLQTALKIDGTYTGPVTGWYGPLTAGGVHKFQVKYALASLWELVLLKGRRVGPKTLAQLNKLFNQ